jgi:hypothetical protein
MIRRHRTRPAVVALVAAVAAVAALAGSASARTSAWTVTPVASGLDSPRGLAFEPNGTLLVAESGHGGDVCTQSAEGPLCLGLTSQISKVDPKTGAHTPLVTGLYSRNAAMEGITGVDGIAAQGGRLVGAMTLYPQALDGWSCAGQPADCADVLAGARAQAGPLIQFDDGGTWKAVAGVGANDLDWAAANPSYSNEPPNANPYGVFGVPAGTYVADAGANVIDFVAANGQITVASAIPPPPPGGFPADTVPTCVTVLHGNLYAGSLSGRFWKRGGSFDPTEVPVQDSSGKSLLHHVTGCASDEKTGAVYLVDMWGTPGPPIPAGPQSTAGTGSVVELAKDGTASVIASGLDFPNGIALAKDGSLYVTVGSTCTAVGTPFPYCAKGGGIVHLQAS